MGAEVKGSSRKSLALERGRISRWECFYLLHSQERVSFTHWKSMLLTVTSSSSLICSLVRTDSVKEERCLAAPLEERVMSLLQMYQSETLVMGWSPILVRTIIILVHSGGSWLPILQGEMIPSSMLLSTSSSSFCFSRHRFSLIFSSLAIALKNGQKQSSVFLNSQNSSFSRLDSLPPRHSLGSLHSASSSRMRLVVTLVPLVSCTEFLLVTGSTSEVLPLGLYCRLRMDLTLANSILSLFSLFCTFLLPIIPSKLLILSLSSRFSFLRASLSSRSRPTYFSSSAFLCARGTSTPTSLCLDCSISMSFSRSILTWLLSSQILDSYSEVLRDLKLLLRKGSLRSERGSRVLPFIDIIQLQAIRYPSPSFLIPPLPYPSLPFPYPPPQQYNKIIPPMFGILSSYDRRSQSIADRARYSSTIASPEQHSLAQKVSKIALMNLRQHDLDICACEECIYSRQLNRKVRIGLDMSKNSSYRSHFDSKYKLKTGRETRIDYEALRAGKGSKSTVVEDSSYGANYRKEGAYEKPEKQRPEDELRFVGPLKSLSSYGEQYPAFKNNASPYIKPLEVSVPNTLKMNLKSVYQSNYSGALQAPTETGKIPDQLHCGLPWTGGSTYQQLFKGHSIKSPPIREGSSTSSRLQKNPSDPNYQHQYQTTYRNEYLLDNRKRCNRSGQPSTNPLLQSLKQTLQS